MVMHRGPTIFLAWNIDLAFVGIMCTQSKPKLIFGGKMFLHIIMHTPTDYPNEPDQGG